MKLEELIQKRFVSTAALAERLTTYNGVPAVFSPEAPGDEQDGWGGETQYPMETKNETAPAVFRYQYSVRTQQMYSRRT